MQINKNIIRLCIMIGLFFAAPIIAHATEEKPYSQASFVEAQKAGKPILVDVSASWCPICAKQKSVLTKLFGDPNFKDMAFYTIDFDSQKEALQSFGVDRQSTLIVFKGSEEKARSVADTSETALRDLLVKAY